MDRGYLKLWRKSLDSDVFHNDSLWKLWTYCLLKANYKQRKVPFKAGRERISVEVGPGQFVFGRKKVSEYLGWSESTTWKRLKKLEDMENINIKSNSKFSIVTIRNWEEYQSDDDREEQRCDSGVTAIEQRCDSDQASSATPEDDNKKAPIENDSDNTDVERNFQEGDTDKKQRSKEEDNKKKNTKKSSVRSEVSHMRPDWISQEQWDAIIIHRRKHQRKPPETELAFKGIINQLEKAMEKGFTLDECLETWLVESSWQSFRAEWMENRHGKNRSNRNGGKPQDHHSGFEGRQYEGTPDEELPEYLR